MGLALDETATLDDVRSMLEVFAEGGSGKSVDVASIISLIQNMMQCESNLPEFCWQTGIDDFWADISRIQDGIGWLAKYTLERGIADTIRHYALQTNENEKLGLERR